MPPTVGQYLECKILDLKIEIITFYKPLRKSEFDVSNILCYCNCLNTKLSVWWCRSAWNAPATT